MRRNTNREKITLLPFKIVPITGIVLKWAGALVKTVDKELIISHLPVLVSPLHREVKNTDGTSFLNQLIVFGTTARHRASPLIVMILLSVLSPLYRLKL